MSQGSATELASTAELLALVRRGDAEAKEHILERYLPVLRRWARGRLPRNCRDLADTDDLVQITLMRTLGRLPHFEPQGEGAFFAYLRQILLNAVREQVRRPAARAQKTRIGEDYPDPMPSLVEEAIGREALEAYENSLARLTALQREAVVLRIEFGLSYPEIATALDSPSPSAARMLVNRALVRIAEQVDDRSA